MAGFRVSTDVHHNPTGPEGRPHMLVLNGWQVWNLTRDEAKELFAQLGLSLGAELSESNQDAPIDAGHPDRPELSEAVDW